MCERVENDIIMLISGTSEGGICAKPQASLTLAADNMLHLPEKAQLCEHTMLAEDTEKNIYQ